MGFFLLLLFHVIHFIDSTLHNTDFSAIFNLLNFFAVRVSYSPVS